MGTPDTYGKLGIQLKVGDALCRHFKIGDTMPEDVEDGVYVDYAGVVVIKDRIFVAEFKDLHTKYGDSVDLQALINGFNPVAHAVAAISPEAALKQFEIWYLTLGHMNPEALMDLKRIVPASLFNAMYKSIHPQD